MSYQSRALGAINVTKDAQKNASETDSHLADLMANPDYLRHSSAVIHDALKQGFDVLQLPNGDIVTTGTKVIVTTYSWDDTRGKLSKRSKAAESKSRRARKNDIDSSAA
jgi:hypothetical protein